MKYTSSIQPLRRLVEQALAAPWSRLSFPPALEARFEADTGLARIKHLAIVGTIGSILFTLFVLVDARLIPDIFLQSMVLRLIGSPITAALLLLSLHTKPKAGFREAQAAIIILIAQLATVYLVYATRSPDKMSGLNGTMVILLYGNVCVQSRFCYALVVTLVSLVAIGAMILVTSTFSGPTKQMLVSMAVCTAVLTMVTNYRLELKERRSYLLGLRETLRSADLSANNIQLQTLSELDSLTGVFNRRALDSRLHDIWAACADQSLPVGVLMIDVDHFKAYNDTNGHQAGDACLRAVAGLLREHSRTREDLVARYGGEEFIVIMPGQDHLACLKSGERIRRAIEAEAIPVDQTGQSDAFGGSAVTVSIGVAAHDGDLRTPPFDLIGLADKALYAAKQAGRNRVWPPFAAAMEECQAGLV